VHQEVKGMLDSCYQAYFAGCLSEAIDLADQAFALDPTSFTAYFLVYKLRVIQSNGGSEDEAESEYAEEVPSSDIVAPQTNDKVSDPDISLRPELPAVDPKVVDALERVLAETGEVAATKLVIIPDEPVETEEQLEEPVSQWPYLSTDFQMPSLFVPTLDPTSLQDEDNDEEDEAPMEDEPTPFSSLNDLLRGALEVLQQGGCIEVDDSQHGYLHFRCQSQAGNIDCQLFQDNAGHGYMTLKLVGVKGDLRAAQQDFNQHVLDWIEEVGGVEPTPVNDDAAPDENALDEEEDEVQTV
jgi:hypothetical protein